MKTIPVVAVGLGLALLASSFVWGMLFPASRAWTEEKANRMSELGLKAHSLGGELDGVRRRPKMYGGRNAADVEAEYEKTTAELAVLREEFQTTRDRPAANASRLRWVGVVCVAIGALAYMAMRES
jgi:hypothetical protein